VGKLNRDSFRFRGLSYLLSQHGFARDKQFSLVEHAPESCLLSLLADESTLKVYPFRFELRIAYSLREDTLSVEYTVINNDLQPIYFSIGAHPGFSCSFTEGDESDTAYLLFESEKYEITRLENGMLGTQKLPLRIPGKKLRLSKGLFENDALVFEDTQIERVSLIDPKSNKQVGLECKNWPFFGIWSKKGSDRFVCLEPWHGIADLAGFEGELSEKAGIKRLDPGSVFSASFSMSFSGNAIPG
jgi:galactose mutarotase-like enzyme